MTLNKKINVAVLWAFFSSVVCLLVLLPLYLYWYPAPFSEFFSAKWILIFAVTLQAFVSFIFIALVYNPLRKDHRFNLGCIAVLQVLFLVLIIYVLGVTRPMWLVQHEDRFYSIQPVHIQVTEQASWHYVLQNFFQKPQIKTVYFSNQPLLKQQQIEQGLAGQGLQHQPQQYQSFDADFATQYAKEISELEQYNSAGIVKIQLAPYKANDLVWLPLNSGFTDSRQDGVVLLNRQGKFLDVVNLRPWN